MIKAGTIAEILALYKKHGWILRRVLLSDGLRVTITEELQNLFGGAEIVSSQLNACWFSRVAKNGNEAWELRRLSEAPFALVEVFEKDADPEDREEVLRETEQRMHNTNG
ncbi:MAG: hypothetical protein JWN60_2862 [Acidobacteria bacterium]|jgi:hypothetical protein|nr:hypothetical protein [Acidobacteriota bacterium]